MRIGVVTTSYPRWPGDPAGSFVAGHVAALEALGHTVDVVGAGRGVAPGALFYRGGAPDRIERQPIASLADAAAFSARLTRAVVARARGWDAVVAHWLVPSGIAALAAHVPTIAIAHGGDVHTLRRFRMLGSTIALLRRRAKLAFVTHELAALAGCPDALVQPMGIDHARFAAIPRRPTTPPTILVVARFTSIKGIDVAIRALRSIARPLRLVIAGDGPEREALVALATGDDRIHFAGEVDATERDALLATASLVVVPSRILANGRTEGMPMIAVEALAAGVPVVASAVGGLVELGVATVPPDDPVALARAIEATIGNPAQRDVRDHDWRVVAPRLLP